MTLTNTDKKSSTCINCAHKAIIQAVCQPGEQLGEPCYACYAKMDEGQYFTQWVKREESAA